MAHKPHIGLEVRDLEKSLAFYRVLFDAEPVKVKPDYAKFDLSDPGLNFSLTLGQPAERVHGHFGVQVENTEAVAAAAKRLATYEEMGTVCCYALQDKVWVTDPDGHRWEYFTVQADAEEFREIIPVAATGLCCEGSAGQA